MPGTAPGIFLPSTPKEYANARPPVEPSSPSPKCQVPLAPLTDRDTSSTPQIWTLQLSLPPARPPLGFLCSPMVRLLRPLFLLLVKSPLGPPHSSPMKLLAPLLPPLSRLPLNPSLLRFRIPRVSLRCQRPCFPHRIFVMRGSLMANGWTRLNRWGVAIRPMCSTHRNLHSIPTMGMMGV